MTLGADVNYKVKKLMCRIRAAEEELTQYKAFYAKEREEFLGTVDALNDQIAKLKTRLANKQNETSLPRGRKKAAR